MRTALFAAAAGVASAQQYFQTTPELYAGPTPTGKPAFLAQTNPAPFPSVSYIAPQPLETQQPIKDAPTGDQGNIFRLQGQLSHYFSNPTGFGVDEYPLPKGAEITQLHMLHRHGSRYPTGPVDFIQKIRSNKYKAKGKLGFLNGYKYTLGEQILVPIGKQELFDSGTLHQYLYGHLYPNNGNKIVARTTTEDRMTKSGEYFLAGFFGLGWTQNATLEVIIEEPNFNNSLAGYYGCKNADADVSYVGDKALENWSKVYLKNAHRRLKRDITFTGGKTDLTISDVHDMQSLCAYETVALGYSSFCDLFTFTEWQGYEYSVDIDFAGNNAFQSPTSRSVGIGFVQEIRARLQHHYLKKKGGSANITLDSMPSTFPLDQNLYFDFSHDTNIMSIITAFGLTQFSKFLPDTHMVDRQLIVSHMEPFGARLDIEIIQSPKPISSDRSAGAKYIAKGGETTYVHFLLNQRTIPLGRSYEVCGNRDDGWCEMEAFLDATKDAYRLSEFDHACNGNYKPEPYGTYHNGNPNKHQKASSKL